MCCTVLERFIHFIHTQVKMVTDDTDENTDIIIEGDDEEIDRFRTELNLTEKGMVRVKGVFEQQA